MEKTQAICQQIRIILSSFDDLVFTEEVVLMLALRCEARENPAVGYIYVTARNWAYSQRRAKIHAANIVVRKQLAIAKAVVDSVNAKKHTQELELATQEFDKLVSTAVSKRTSMPDALRYMRLVCIEDKSDAECADTFPGTNRDQRYQWLKRARDLIMPRASTGLKRFLWNSNRSNRNVT